MRRITRGSMATTIAVKLTRSCGVRALTLAMLGLSIPFAASAQNQDPSPWERVRDQSRTERRARDNGRFVLALTEQFARSHDGRYPASVSELMSIWPGRPRLRNPNSGLEIDPIDGAAASSGQCGYIPVTDEEGNLYGATISVFGTTSNLLWLLAPPGRDD